MIHTHIPQVISHILQGLEYRSLPELSTLILGTPPGPFRDLLTEANIHLSAAADGLKAAAALCVQQPPPPPYQS